ncbi:MAG: hypothetical protein E4G95_03210 [Bacteroidia bacterium]|nr:MAG: hypothetical protein E4G95_03210 [Bacteroidia bacterium]
MSRLLKISFLFILISQTLAGQKLVNSPYGRLGPGIMVPQGLLKTLGMGGAGIAVQDPVNINYLNPASYASIDTNSFIFDFGFDYQILTLNDGDEKYRSEDMGFHHIVIGFPVSRKAGFVFGLVPFSSGYYNIASSVGPGDPRYRPIAGEIDHYHKGAGGYNKFFWGFGISPLKNLSLGINMEFMFGTITRVNNYIFVDGTNYYNNSTTESILIRGFNFKYAAQYKFDLGTDYFVSTGFTYSPEKKYRSDYEDLITKHSPYTGTIYSTDTLSYSFTDDIPIVMPRSFTAGIAFGKNDKFTVAVDYTGTNWSESQFAGYEQYLVNSSSLNFGIEFIPQKYANTNIVNRVEYRLGGHTSGTLLMVNNEQIKDFGISFGAGIPMNRTKSKVNFLFEYGKRKGSIENGLHEEAYLNFAISFNFYDSWFKKKQYN